MTKGSDNMKEQQTEQQQAFKRAQVAGYAKHVAQLNGGTGDLRRELSEKERLQRKARRKMQKASRKGNR